MEPIEPGVGEGYLLQCSSCGHVLNVQNRYCPNCGVLQTVAVEIIPEHTFNGQAKVLCIFYLVYLITCLSVEKIDSFNDYRNLVWIEVFLAVWTIVFAFANFEKIIPLYSFKNVRLPMLVFCAAGAVLFSVIVSLGMDWLNLEVFGKRLNYYSLYRNLDYKVPVFFLSMAVYPAIIEELGFRGVFYNYVDSVAGASNAIFISSMAFAILHVSIISLVWIVPFALFAAYLRYRYQTLWYGMVFHLFFNGTVCVAELWKANGV